MQVNFGRAFKLMRLIKGLMGSDREKSSHLMSDMHGLPQKIGQHLTLYQGQGLNCYYETLCTKSKNEDIELDKIFQSFDLGQTKAQVVAQASIGQVYRLDTKNGSLALKVKYPGIDKEISGDLGFLKRLAWPLKFLPLKNSGIFNIIENLETLLTAECDYKKEAEIQQQFHLFFREKDIGVDVPEIRGFNEQAILSAWAAGKDLRHYRDSLDEWLVKTWLTFTLESLKSLGMLHADPHPGNFIVSDKNDGGSQLTVVDFGSTAVFSHLEKAAVIRLLSGAYEDVDGLVKDLSILGVDHETLETYQPIIGDLVSILLEPFYTDEPYDFANWRLQYRINTLLASRTWEKPLTISVKMLLLVRAFQGIYFYARRGRVLFNWREAVIRHLG
jgi:predicted unusual protein kinase regulating ubiquinone biosynthesis (AarF/ABC1/UbiB family)